MLQRLSVSGNELTISGVERPLNRHVNTWIGPGEGESIELLYDVVLDMQNVPMKKVWASRYGMYPRSNSIVRSWIWSREHASPEVGGAAGRGFL